VVSTDSAEIAAVSRKLRAEIVWRPAELCTDTSSSESGLLHCLDYLKNEESTEPELVVFLQPTSPLRSPSLIEEAVEFFDNNEADSLFSAGPLLGLAWKIDDDGVVPVSYDPQNRKRRQDACNYIAENGSIYIFKPWVLRDLNCRLGGKIVAFRMDSMDSFEVDEPDDVPLVDFLLRHRYPDLVREAT
jgi:N-acylneuraminate cytidylyltransferase